MEVLMREKSIRSRVATLARFSIFTPTADAKNKTTAAAFPPLFKDASAQVVSQRL